MRRHLQERLIYLPEEQGEIGEGEDGEDGGDNGHGRFLHEGSES